ncbi:Protein of unknown function DUF4728 [Trinorchestia longiramus]|nr:Protein of unknown function DUF4728 [Trinorchestia longiramus]
MINTLVYTIFSLMLWIMNFLPQLLSMLENALAQSQGDLSVESDDYDEIFFNRTEADEQIREAIEVLKDNVFPVKVAFLVLLALAFLSIITSSMLIHGVRKNSRGLLVPWLMQEVVHGILGLTLVILIFIVFGSHNIAWTTAIPIFACICIQIFFMLVVVSQYQALGLIRMHDEMCMK